MTRDLHFVINLSRALGTRTGLIVGSIFWLLCVNGSVHAAPNAFPFQNGERLSFQIFWGFIPAAHVSLEVIPVEQEQDGAPAAAYHFMLSAYTLPVIDLIYPYRERIDSYVVANVQHSLLYKKVQESRHSRDIVVQFDWDNGVARYTNYGKPSATIPLQPGTLDPLAALYYIRTQALSGDFNLEQWVTDGKKLSRGKARFIQKETLTIQGKTYQTIKLEPDLREVTGVFEKSPDAKMYVWLTDDDRKIVVKLKSKVTVGSFVAELLEGESVIPSAEPPGQQADSIQ